MSQAKTTTDHKVIQKWVEARKGTPSKVRESGEGGILRIDFGEPEASLEPMDWDEFFEVFEDRKLAFLYQEKGEDGGVSRFNKFVSRATH